jgi:hypothetical protein
MRRNRKKVETYRFNGYPHLNSRSILSVRMAELAERIKKWEAKLADPADPDDKKWTAQWLERYRREYEKKQAGREFKKRERRTAARSQNA